MDVSADDAAFEALIKRFDQEMKVVKPKIGGFFTVNPSLDEAIRAHYLEPVIFGDSVDEDSNYRPLNPPVRVSCTVCRFPDITCVPNPFLVSKMVLKKQEVFRVSTGMLVVRHRVLKLLQDAIGDQFESGEASISKSKEKLKGEERVYWVRPKAMTGDRILKVVGEQCPHCKRCLSRGVGMTDQHVNERRGGLVDKRDWVESFGRGKSDIAVMGGFHGRIEDGVPRWHWPILMSGALLAHLKTHKVTGIAISTSQVPAQAYFSAGGEPAFESQERSFESSATPVGPSKADQRVDVGRKATVKLRNVPWDCDADGFVHLYLTTPEVVVIDPMTWEEDSDGPYRVPKFKKPGLYQLPVKAIRDAEGRKRGVAVDSATLLLIDNAFFTELQDCYDWDKATKSDGSLDVEYHNAIAGKIGSRFAVCTTPPEKFNSEFVGDGFYTIDAKQI
jgi:hypothetical protein